MKVLWRAVPLVLLFLVCQLWVSSPATLQAAAPGTVRWGYHITYDSNSLASVRANIRYLTHLSPYWYQMNAEGALTKLGQDQDEVTALAAANGVALVPMIKNSAQYGDFHAVLADAGVRQRAVAAIRDEVAAHGYAGINVDFEGLDATDRPHLTTFMAELSAALRQQGKLVTMAVPAKDQERTTGWAGAYDYAALAASSDLVVLMAYGTSPSTGSPKAAGALPWVENVTKYAAQQMGSGKVVLGMPMYGFDWNLASGPPATSRCYVDTLRTVLSYGGTFGYDEAAQTAWAKYSVQDVPHEVWYDDVQSIAAKMGVARKLNLAGVGMWRLGHEDPGVWTLLESQSWGRNWFLAEGSTGEPFDTWILLMNPAEQAVKARLTFLREGQPPVARDYTLAPTSRFSVFANDVLPNSAISTQIQADAPVWVERAMYNGHDGHASTAVAEPARAWHFAEGQTGPNQHTWLLLMNPGDKPVQATIRFEGEGMAPPSRQVTVPARSRQSVFINQWIPEGRFGMSVEANGDIIAERALYGPQGDMNGVVGTTRPLSRWLFAEGFNGPGHETWIQLSNPQSEVARVRLEYMLEGGATETRTLDIGPSARVSVRTGDVVPDRAFSVSVWASRPIVAERTSRFAGGQGSHTAFGVPAAAKEWLLPEGSTAAPFNEFVLLQNPNSTPALATVTFMKDNGQRVERGYTLAPTSRLTIHVNTVVPDTALSTRVVADQPIVVERAMYFSQNTGGHATAGIPHW